MLQTIGGMNTVFLGLCDKIISLEHSSSLVKDVHATMMQMMNLISKIAMDPDVPPGPIRAASIAESAPMPAVSIASESDQYSGVTVKRQQPVDSDWFQPTPVTASEESWTMPTIPSTKIPSSSVPSSWHTQVLNCNHLFAPTISSSLPLPWTYSHNETSLARWLARSTHDIGLRWLTEPERHVPELTCRFQFVMHDFEIEFLETVRWCIFESIALQNRTMRSSTAAPEESHTLPAGTLVSLRTASRRTLSIKRHRDTSILSDTISRRFTWSGMPMHQTTRAEREWMNANEVTTFLYQHRSLRYTGQTYTAEVVLPTSESFSTATVNLAALVDCKSVQFGLPISLLIITQPYHGLAALLGRNQAIRRLMSMLHCTTP